MLGLLQRGDNSASRTNWAGVCTIRSCGHSRHRFRLRTCLVAHCWEGPDALLPTGKFGMEF